MEEVELDWEREGSLFLDFLAFRGFLNQLKRLWRTPVIFTTPLFSSLSQLLSPVYWHQVFPGQQLVTH